ncbi:hypothetical protein EXU57_06670 [Segetibacter sp. 3557_3]|uniref:hypothetical protein n=1 Tax=Segetibacter sp. 3557_3 TaxID=2547429 RepID=UPI0010586C3C|nr:hypothetical protein [Segetibacter sp. 3557_3]TDH27268.1 hypothetical protein EXU57_06670 [Segetibacter sp. 3557_3]
MQNKTTAALQRPAENIGSYFTCEVLMTAGPRKKFMDDPGSDIDLGEDVCGFISTSSEILSWLFDGTSDLHCLKNPASNREYFSSRLLAQCLSNTLKRAYLQQPATSLDELVASAILKVRDDWREVLNGLPEEEKDLLTSNINNKNFPECAATIMAARFSLDGSLSVYRSGDSKMLLFESAGNSINHLDTSLASKNPDSNDRIFFRMVLDAEGELDIVSNQPDYEVVNQEGIGTIICMSDGVGLSTEMLLKEDYDRDPQKVRDEIIYQSQGTRDDKVICFIELNRR